MSDILDYIEDSSVLTLQYSKQEVITRDFIRQVVNSQAEFAVSNNDHYQLVPEFDF